MPLSWVLSTSRAISVRSWQDTDSSSSRLEAVPIACDGAVCLVLKRLDDAERDNDPIYATIRGSRVAVGMGPGPGWRLQPGIDPARPWSRGSRGRAGGGRQDRSQSGPTDPAAAERPSILAEESGGRTPPRDGQRLELGWQSPVRDPRRSGSDRASRSRWSDRVESTARRTTARSVCDRGR